MGHIFALAILTIGGFALLLCNWVENPTNPPDMGTRPCWWYYRYYASGQAERDKESAPEGPRWWFL